MVGIMVTGDGHAEVARAYGGWGHGFAGHGGFGGHGGSDMAVVVDMAAAVTAIADSIGWIG